MRFDPFSLAGLPDAPAAFALARDRSSVWVEPEVVHVLGYAASVEVLADHHRFSSDGARHGPVSLSGPSAPTSTLNSSDPPEHTRLRRLVAAPFTRARVAGLGGSIRSTAHRLLDRAFPPRQIDVVCEFANPLVLAVLGQILGIPPVHHEALRHWSDTITAPRDRSDVERARSGLAAVIHDLVREPGRVPPGSLLAELVADQARRGSSIDELVTQCTVLVVAGNETTRNLIGGAVHTLATRPDIWEALSADPSRVPAFVEEALRFHSAVQAAVRYTTAATTLGGIRAPAKTPVFVWVGAANRDPSFAPRPEAFDLGRNGRHLAFGFGIHACLGAHLARLEAAVAVDVLLERYRSIRLAGTGAGLGGLNAEPGAAGAEAGVDAVAMLRAPLARGPARLVVELEPAGTTRARA